MNVKFYFVVLMTILVAVACNVDENYDLSNVSFDDIEIGSEESIFTVPIATITLTSGDLNGTGSGTAAAVASSVAVTRATSDLSFTDILALINAFLPSGTEVNVSDLTDESKKGETIADLADELVKELQSSEQKIAELAAVMYEYQERFDDSLFAAIGLDSSKTYSEEEFQDAIKATLSSGDMDTIAGFTSAICNLIDVDIASELEEYSEMEIDQSVDSVEIPSELVDILGGDDETGSIIATYTHNFPFVFAIDEIVLNSGDQSIVLKLTTEGEESVLNTYKISEISSILSDGANLSSGITLETYIPAAMADYAIVVKIAIQKSGSLKF